MSESKLVDFIICQIMKRIFFSFLFFPLFFLSGCALDNINSYFDSPDNVLIVRGAVYEKSAAKAPLQGIKVVMSAYLKEDTKQINPVKSVEMLTNNKGEFEFIWKSFSFMHTYVLEAKDIEGNENGGRYKKDKIEIQIRRDSPSFDIFNHTYTVEGNFFYLEPLSN